MFCVLIAVGGDVTVEYARFVPTPSTFVWRLGNPRMTDPLLPGPEGLVWICAAFALFTVCAIYAIRTARDAASTTTVPWPVAGDVLAGTSCALSSGVVPATTPPCALIWPRISPLGNIAV